MENKIEGYCVLTDTISGWELTWRIQEEDSEYPQIFETEHEARVAIVEDTIDDLKEFVEGDREWEEIHQMDQYLVAEISIDTDGRLLVWESGKELKHGIIETTLENWRSEL